jgi:L-lactate dehydrogenase complex protein LldG
VAENGAIWLAGSALPARSLAFLSQHVLVVLSSAGIVADMHRAYARLGRGLGDYGVFVSGPSKTADIEQTLVVGAHGPRSLTVALLP